MNTGHEKYNRKISNCQFYRRVCFDQVPVQVCLIAAARLPRWQLALPCPANPSYHAAWWCRRCCCAPLLPQGNVISYDDAFSPSNASAQPIPQLDITGVRYVWAGRGHVGSNPDALGSRAKNHHAPLSVRFASAYETSAELRDPKFSTCITPIIIWQVSSRAALVHA